MHNYCCVNWSYTATQCSVVCRRQDLAKFGERVVVMHSDLEKSEIYNRDCSLADSWVLIDQFVHRLDILESEAHDLIELQDLLEASVVDFDLLPQYVTRR